jgi:hypothetical protein
MNACQYPSRILNRVTDRDTVSFDRWKRSPTCLIVNPVTEKKWRIVPRVIHTLTYHGLAAGALELTPGIHGDGPPTRNRCAQGGQPVAPSPSLRQ